MRIPPLLVAGLVLATLESRLTIGAIPIIHDPANPVIAFAAAEIESALARTGTTDGTTRIVLTPGGAEIVRAAVAAKTIRPPEPAVAEGFSVRRSTQAGRPEIWVIGADDGGILYGGLEIAEIITTRGLSAIADDDQHPHMALRGVKFNIPLDVRTPSYTDVCDSAQQNIATVWDYSFWTEFIDRLARNRYNFISCWNLHPFPSLVRVPEYPQIALDDVLRSTVKWNETYPLQGLGFDAPEILENVETLWRLTIDEKIDFWRRVMRYGRDRNVHFAFVTWNIFVNGTEGKYGITDDFENRTTRDYFRRSVAAMFATYPDLLGIGLTTGENFKGADFQEKEDWAFATYGQGALDAAAAHPDRNVLLIHRQHQTGAKDIARTFGPAIKNPNLEFVFSFKYAQAHVMSSIVQPFKDRFVEDIGEMKTLWTLRNDDNYLFRWGGAGFVRDFIRNIPIGPSRGFYYGSDQWVWGREFLSTEPTSPRQLEIAKHWYHWMLWGRLGYNPDLGDDRLVGILQTRFPEVPGTVLFEGWQAASMTYPLTTGFHWGALDFQWYIEACQSLPGPANTPGGFHDINRFISLPPHPGTDNVSIPQFVSQSINDEPIEGTTPLRVVQALHANADRALALVSGLHSRGNKELRRTLDDIHCMAFLGKYYAHKIRAATALQFFRETLDRAEQQTVEAELNMAAFYWRTYVSTLLANYENDPLWTNRVGYVDFRDLLNDVMYDLTITGSPVKVPSMQPTPGGVILEAEAGSRNGAPVRSDTEGFTGTGYVDFGGSEGRRYVEWNFDAPATGTYTLEIRYTMRRASKPSSRLVVNGTSAEGALLWSSPTSSTWVWDRRNVQLKRGANVIRLYPGAAPLVDHVNILLPDR